MYERMSNLDIGYASMIAELILFNATPVFFKYVKYNIINIFVVSAISSVLFSSLYLAYKYFYDHSYFKKNIHTKGIPNILELTANPIENLQNSKVLGISMLNQIVSCSKYASLLFLPISIAIPLQSLSIFLVLFFSSYINKDKITSIDYIASCISIVGIICIQWNIITSGSTSNKIWGYLLGLGLLFFSMCLNSYVFTITKDMSNIITPQETMLDLNFGGLILISIVWCIYANLPSKLIHTWSSTRSFPTMDELKIAILFFMTIANISNLLYFISLEYLPEITVSIFLNADIFFALILGYIFFNESISISKVVGCIIILISCLLIVLKDTDRMKTWQTYMSHRIHTI